MKIKTTTTINAEIPLYRKLLVCVKTIPTIKNKAMKRKKQI